MYTLEDRDMTLHAFSGIGHTINRKLTILWQIGQVADCTFQPQSLLRFGGRGKGRRRSALSAASTVLTRPEDAAH